MSMLWEGMQAEYVSWPSVGVILGMMDKQRSGNKFGNQKRCLVCTFTVHSYEYRYGVGRDAGRICLLAICGSYTGHDGQAEIRQ